MPQMQSAMVTATEELSPGVLQITIAFDQPFSFRPGQWVSVHSDQGVSRAYCIASAPQRPAAVQIAVRLGSGPGSEALRGLKVGNRVEVEEPQGRFTIPDDDRRDVVFLSGDVGVAPVRSIVLHLRATRDSRKVTVLYEPTDESTIYAGDLKRMGDAGSIRYRRGRIEELIRDEKDAFGHARIMAAGFDPFLERAIRQLEASGIPRESVVTESYGTL